MDIYTRKTLISSDKRTTKAKVSQRSNGADDSWDSIGIGTGERGIFLFDKNTEKTIKVESDDPRLRKVGHVRDIGDEIPPTRCMATANGPVFTSKSALKRHYKKLGYEITGGDHLKTEFVNPVKEEEKYDKQLQEDITKSYYDVKYDRVEFDEDDKKAHNLEKDKKWTLKAPI